MIRGKFCILTGVMCPSQGIASRDGHSVDHLIGDVDFGYLGEVPWKVPVFCFIIYLADILRSCKSCLYSNPPSSDLASNDHLFSLGSIFTMIAKSGDFSISIILFYAYQLFMLICSTYF